MDSSEQNLSLKEWGEFKKAIDTLDDLVLKVVVRGSHDSGVRRAHKSAKDKEEGTPPYYNDPTGESAVRYEVDDTVRAKIVSMVNHIHNALSLAKNVIDITPPDVAERAKRSVPDCLACGKPVEGKILSGYDRRCYNRWVYLGRPDRSRFERERIKEIQTTFDVHSNPESTSRVYNTN